MLLQALVKHYEILAAEEDSGIPLRGYGKTKVSYALTLSQEGELVGLLPLKRPDAAGKKLLAPEMLVPEPVKRASGVAANFLCDNVSYVLGFDDKGKPQRTQECFAAFRALHQAVLGEHAADCAEAQAVLLFLEHWDCEQAAEHPLFAEYLADFYKGANFVFRLEGTVGYVHESPRVRALWERYRSRAGESAKERVCLVTGEHTAVARLHPAFKGLRDGLPTGNTLVSFNDSAYESYGNDKAQGLNAPVGEYAAFAYGAALNHLLSDSAHRMFLGDATLVFWAESPDSGTYQDIFALMNSPEELDKIDADEGIFVRDPAAVADVKGFFEKLRQGAAVSRAFSMGEDVRFYVLAISPNAARISVRFLLCDSFGAFRERLGQHYADLAIEKQFDKDRDSISIWQLLNETVSPTSTKKAASPLLAGAVMRSVLTGSAYPVALLQAILLRVRAEKEINYVKASVIKACLSRCNYTEKYKKEGVLEMSLNPLSDNRAYVLGRLFAALEQAQREAIPGINTTIKDRYFTSASASPATVFPTLLQLSKHHISKLEYGFRHDALIGEILEKVYMDEHPFPKRLSLEDQGVFVLGYYHQKNQIIRDIRTAAEQKKARAEQKSEK